MNVKAGQASVFYIDDMEDEVIITRMKIKRERVDLNIRYFLDDQDLLSTLEDLANQPAELPDLLITDLNMPGQGGLGLIGAIREDRRYDGITISACTGSENPADRTAALAAGADVVAVKPFGRDSLAEICAATGRFELLKGQDGQDRLHVAGAWRRASGI